MYSFEWFLSSSCYELSSHRLRNLIICHNLCVVLFLARDSIRHFTGQATWAPPLDPPLSVVALVSVVCVVPQLLQLLHLLQPLHPVADPGQGPGGVCPPCFFHQNEARKAEKIFLETGLPPPSLTVKMTARPPPPPYLKGCIRH